MEIIKKKKRGDVHPYIPELKELYRGGRITRREFVRNAAMLGLSLSSASAFLAACAPATPEVIEKEVIVEKEVPVTVEVEKEVVVEKVITATPASVVKRGGILRVDWPWIPYVDDPAKDGVGTSEAARCAAETLVQLDENNALHPLLCERWEASEDVKEWTLYLQQGVKFNNGKDFNADDVVWNFLHWLDPDTGSPLGDKFSFLSPSGVEKVDDYTVKLHLDKPSFTVPYHLWSYSSIIMPEGGCAFYDGEAIGTGPYLMKEFHPDERMEFVRREGYWQDGVDGKPLPYLDGIRFLFFEDDPAKLAAMTKGELDILYGRSPAGGIMEQLEKNPDIVVERKHARSTNNMRVRCDTAPFDDPRVRNAMKWCQDRERIRQLTYFGHGLTAYDHWVSPINPAYYPLEDRPQDIDRARALLAEAGYPDGLETEITVEAGERGEDMALVYKEEAAKAGIRVIINALPGAAFWDQWDEWPFAITGWNGRPVFANLTAGCRCGAVWNEMHWCNEEFDAVLDQIQATLDVEERRGLVRRLEEIMQEDSGFLLPYWSDASGAYRRQIQNYTKHTAPHYYLLNVWLA